MFVHPWDPGMVEIQTSTTRGAGMDILLCVVGGIMTSVACLELVLQPESSW